MIDYPKIPWEKSKTKKWIRHLSIYNLALHAKNGSNCPYWHYMPRMEVIVPIGMCSPRDYMLENWSLQHPYQFVLIVRISSMKVARVSSLNPHQMNVKF